MSHPKKERNKRIIKLRSKDPKKWSYGNLAKEFNVSKITAYAIVKRETTNKVLTNS